MIYYGYQENAGTDPLVWGYEKYQLGHGMSFWKITLAVAVMRYPMSVRDALSYERMLLSGYLRDSKRRPLTAVEKKLYAQKVEWIRNLEKLDEDGFRVVAADGTALGPARKQDIEEAVEVDVWENYNRYGDFN